MKSSLALFVWYFVIMFILPWFIGSFWEVSDTFVIIFEIFTYASLLIGSILVFGKRLRRDFQAVKNDWRTYARWFFPRAGMIYILYIGVALVSALLSNKQSENQVLLTEMPLWFMGIMSCLYAPLVEECVFRGAIRKFVRRDWLFIIVSGITFGLIHVTGEATLLDAIILGLPYTAIGCGVAYLYAKSDNMLTNITYHFLHNLLSIILIISLV